MSRVLCLVAALGCQVFPGGSLAAQSLNDTLVLVSSEGRESVRIIRTRQRDMVALDDLAEVFGFQIAPDERENTATATFNGSVIILTEDQQLVSVAGRLVSLRTAPLRADDRWLVPLDFINRALAPFLDQTLEVRQRSRLVLIGNVQVPRITGQYRAQDDDGGRLTFEVTPSTPLSVVQDGWRLVVRFEADALDVEREPGIRGDLVSQVLVHPSAAELLVDLGPAFSAFSVSSRPVPNDSTELTIDLTAAPRTVDADPETPVTPAPPAASPFPAGAVDTLPDLRMAPTVRVVALDAGHGGGDDGTRGSDGTLEKDITLSVTRRLRDAIERRLGLRVILTRGRDDAIPLDQRAAVANNNKADLFISLHVSASIRPSATGAEVFYLSMDEYGAEARELAQREGQLVPVIGGGLRAIDLVEWDMAQVRYLDRSARLAGIVHEELGRRVPMSTRGVQEAPFRVLVGANMPAVLVEMGFISNPEDEQRLSSARFQNAVVEALVDSILRFRRYVESTSEPQVSSRPSTTQVRDE